MHRWNESCSSQVVYCIDSMFHVNQKDQEVKRNIENTSVPRGDYTVKPVFFTHT
jgi:hypothetical protein